MSFTSYLLRSCRLTSSDQSFFVFLLPSSLFLLLRRARLLPPSGIPFFLSSFSHRTYTSSSSVRHVFSPCQTSSSSSSFLYLTYFIFSVRHVFSFRQISCSSSSFLHSTYSFSSVGHFLVRSVLYLPSPVELTPPPPSGTSFPSVRSVLPRLTSSIELIPSPSGFPSSDQFFLTFLPLNLSLLLRRVCLLPSSDQFFHFSSSSDLIPPPPSGINSLAGSICSLYFSAIELINYPPSDTSSPSVGQYGTRRRGRKFILLDLQRGASESRDPLGGGGEDTRRSASRTTRSGK